MATHKIFAGVNEAGKTSIYKSTYYEQKKIHNIIMQCAPFIVDS